MPLVYRRDDGDNTLHTDNVMTIDHVGNDDKIEWLQSNLIEIKIGTDSDTLLHVLPWQHFVARPQ